MNGETIVFATLGDPIGQVQTPILIPPILDRRQINATWIPLHTPAGQLAPVIAGLRLLPNVRGFTVTVPHKQAMLALCDEASPRAHAAGGVNLVRRDADGRLLGDMVDGVGFVAGLIEAGHVVSGTTAWIVGAGGAGAAIAVALAEAGVGRIFITEADKERGLALAERIRSFRPGLPASVVDGMPGVPDFAINATPIGMSPTDPLPFDVDQLPSDCIVCEVIMKPAETRLLGAARARGLKVQPGRPMLEAQIGLYLKYLGLEGDA